MLNPNDVFTSADKFERLTRAEIAELLNSGLEDSEVVDVDDVDIFSEGMLV